MPSSYDGKVIIAKDIREIRNTINSVEQTYDNGITVSMSMEQSEELRCVTSEFNSNIVDLTNDDGANDHAEEFAAFHTFLMSHTRTTQIARATVSSMEDLSGRKSPMKIEIEVLFDDSSFSNGLRTGDVKGNRSKPKPISKSRKASLGPTKIMKGIRESVSKRDLAESRKLAKLALKTKDDNKMLDLHGKTSKSASKIKKPSPGKKASVTKRSTPNKVSKNSPQTSAKEKKICLALQKVGDSSKSTQAHSTIGSNEITDKNQTIEESKFLKLCKYYLDGNCSNMFGLSEQFCRFLHGGPLPEDIQDVLREHILYEDEQVVGKEFVENVRWKYTSTQMVHMLTEFQSKLRTNSDGNRIENDNLIPSEIHTVECVKNKTDVVLNETQWKTLRDLKIHRPEDALNLTLGQLNSIGINKGEQLEAILAIALNSKNVDMSRMLPLAPAPQEVNSNSVTCNEDDDDSERPLVIDETVESTEPEDETMAICETVNKGDEHEQDHLDVEMSDQQKLRVAIVEVGERLKEVNNSNAPRDAKMKEVEAILIKLNELETQYKTIKEINDKNHSNHELLYKPQQNDNLVEETYRDRIEAGVEQDLQTGNDKIPTESMQDKHFRKEESSKVVSNGFQNKYIEVLKNELKDQSNHSAEMSENTTAELIVNKNNNALEKTEAENKNESQNTSMQSLCPKELENNIKKFDDVNRKFVKKRTADDRDKMTLRSQRKEINMSSIKRNKICMEEKVKKSPTKIVLGNVKSRRLKLPKRSNSQDSGKSTKSTNSDGFKKPSSTSICKSTEPHTSNHELVNITQTTSDVEKVKEIDKNLNDTYNKNTNKAIAKNLDRNKASAPESPAVQETTNELLLNSTSKVRRQIDFDMKLEEGKHCHANTSTPILSPISVEISSPTSNSINNLSNYTPAKEIDAYMNYPPMDYCLHEIIIPDREINKPEFIHKLLHTTTVDPRLLKYKEKNCTDIYSPQRLPPYFPSGQISQYDPRQRNESPKIPYRVQNQNPNMLLYNYLQKSPWYQTLMSTMKIQINHSVAELVRALNNFYKERLLDYTAIFDIFKIDCAGELLEIMRNVGISIDSNGIIAEAKSFDNYPSQSFNNLRPSSSTYSFISPTLPSPHRQQTHLQGYVPPAPPFVSCYLSSPPMPPMTPRRHCGTIVPYGFRSKSTTPPPRSAQNDEEESWDSPPTSPKSGDRVGSKHDHHNKPNTDFWRNGRTSEQNGRRSHFHNYRRNRY